MFLGYILAVLAATANATSNVLQRRANREEPPELSMSPKLIAELLRSKVWLAGLVTVILSFLLMAAALGLGRLAAVQPIVVLELPLTLIGASRFFGTRLAGRDWVAIGVMSVGLAGFIAFLAPHAGNNGRAPGWVWAIGSAASLGVVGVTVLFGVRRQGPGRAALLGVATGVTFGLTAAFMKGMTVGFHHGVFGVVVRWQTYAMILAGLAGMFLMQNALQAGRLVAAQPGITLADPAVAVLWGVLGFNESTQGGWRLGVAVLSGAAMAAGAAVLARSPALEGNEAAQESGARVERAGAVRSR